MARRFAAFFLAFILVFSLCCSAIAEQYPELVRGDKDSGDTWAVYSLQLKLIELGYLDGKADGHFGGGTEKAVKLFQEEHGLEVTGIADPATQEKLYSIRIDASGVITEGEDTLEADTSVTNRVDTTILQSYLYTWGYTVDEPDGLMGMKTKEALKELQKASLEDMKAFTEARRAAATPSPTPEPTPTPEPGQQAEIIDVLIEAEPEIVADGNITPDWYYYIENGYDWRIDERQLGDKGKDVLRVQRRLRSLDYLPGGDDGFFGEHTEVALKYFQRLNGLPETGVTDEDTMLKLFSNDVITSDKYVTMYKAMVSVKDQRVYIYQWTGTDYTALVHTFKCSSGAPSTPTILGTYQAPGRNGEWYFMEDSDCWVRYAFVIEGGYFFHSVLFDRKGGEPTASSVRNLGTAVSHGCIRMAVEDVQWIYENCSNGMTVVIYDD